MPLKNRLNRHAEAVNTALAGMLDERREHIPLNLLAAMRYSLLAGGKRVRPSLMLECHAACGGRGDIMPAVMGIECIHTYSLIHDDLPCMDDDDLRRGQATCHRRFDEATAVLAADALQALGFELTVAQPASPEVRVELVRRLSLAAGAQGMVGGQALDMQAEAQSVESLDDVVRIHNLKTGALLQYCCEAGALLADASDDRIEACSRFGSAVGLLFQLADDILDATASSAQLGKSAGKDAAQSKATCVSLLGLEEARAFARRTLASALEAAAVFGEHGETLKALATYILERKQ